MHSWIKWREACNVRAGHLSGPSVTSESKGNTSKASQWCNSYRYSLQRPFRMGKTILKRPKRPCARPCICQPLRVPWRQPYAFKYFSLWKAPICTLSAFLFDLQILLFLPSVVSTHKQALCRQFAGHMALHSILAMLGSPSDAHLWWVLMNSNAHTPHKKKLISLWPPVVRWALELRPLGAAASRASRPTVDASCQSERSWRGPQLTNLFSY